MSISQKNSNKQRPRLKYLNQTDHLKKFHRKQFWQIEFSKNQNYSNFLVKPEKEILKNNEEDKKHIQIESKDNTILKNSTPTFKEKSREWSISKISFLENKNGKEISEFFSFDVNNQNKNSTLIFICINETHKKYK